MCLIVLGVIISCIMILINVYALSGDNQNERMCLFIFICDYFSSILVDFTATIK